MDMFAPEFSRYWLPEAAGTDARDAPAPRDPEALRQEREALEALAERVNAARCTV